MENVAHGPHIPAPTVPRSSCTTDQAKALVGQPSFVRIYVGPEVPVVGILGRRKMRPQQVSVGATYIGGGAPSTCDGEKRYGGHVSITLVNGVETVRTTIEHPPPEWSDEVLAKLGLEPGEIPTQLALCMRMGDWEVLVIGDRRVDDDVVAAFAQAVSFR